MTYKSRRKRQTIRFLKLYESILGKSPYQYYFFLNHNKVPETPIRHHSGAPGGARTRTVLILSQPPLPIGLRGRLHSLVRRPSMTAERPAFVEKPALSCHEDLMAKEPA